MSEVDWESGRITDAGIAHMRSRLGPSNEVPGWNLVVTQEAVEHFALGIGDDNPLWWDPAYAVASPWGRSIAPPCYLYSHCSGPRLRPDQGQSSTERFLPGVMGLLAGERWRWNRPVAVGETLRAEAALMDVAVVEGRFGGRSVSQLERISFISGDECVAVLDQTIRRFERQQTRARNAPGERPLATWTPEDLAGFARQYEAELAARRGSEPRWFEDVRVGAAIGPLLKGPLTITGMIGFLLGVGSANTPTNRMTTSFLDLHPGARLTNPTNGTPDTLKAAHFDTALAQASGMVTGYDFGIARVSWFAHALTDWAGDGGFVVELESQVRRPNFLGDVTWVRGTVATLDAAAGEVTVELSAINQLDEQTATGVAKVRLPRKPMRTATVVPRRADKPPAPRAAAAAVDWENGRITEAGIDKLRRDIGVTRPNPGWNRLVTAQTIEHFALGIGDDNPLWWGEAHAKASRWGERIAPPCYLYSHTRGPRLAPADGKTPVEAYLPGVLGVWAGETWRWIRPAREGEIIRAESQMVEVVVQEGRFGGPSVTHVERKYLLTESDELVAEVEHTVRRYERARVRDRRMYLDRPLAAYTAEDRARFEAQYRSEAAARRGAVPRYVDDLRVGDKVGPILKGPLTLTNLVGFLLGGGSPLNATNRMLHTFLTLHPGLKMIHPETGSPDTIEAPHWEPALARASGLPGGYDIGFQRVSWASHLITDWAGDDGFLSELDVQLVRPNILGDVTWVSGEVIGVEVPAQRATVVIVGRNQLNEITMRGTAKVTLPRRGK